MTILEQIAEKMGWEVEHGHISILLQQAGWIRVPIDTDIGTYFEGDRIAKLLQARMVKDRWEITIIQRRPDSFIAIGWHGRHEPTIECWNLNTEPAAIVSLYCKVYGIKEGE